ncbi:barstar family protein [Streptomyces pacificus]|uniref:Barstar family protein n=1 Tax=Streptomyces pacificus TaxID=2705029 RepID=A0A6A0B1U1_9ACTN|nr:barstar family protein [Streptomyces pacificus]GFH38561.1 barstar family protein [Streptomyces pacificus]
MRNDPLAALFGATPGRNTTVLDLHGVIDKRTFMERCATGLGLPPWFGRNWDALADCLTDLPGQEGTLVLVTRWQEYAAARPGEWRLAQDVFGRAVDTMPGRLAVLLALGGSDERASCGPG